MKTKALLVLVCAMLSLPACKKDESQTSAASEVTAPATTSATAPVATTPNNEHNPSYPTYAVGSEVSYEPFSFKDELGQPIGFEVDLLNAIGKAGKFNVTFIDTPRNAIEDTLNNDQFQIWASALSVSPERLEVMDMSEPYLDFSRELYVLDKPENAALKTVADLKGKKIAVNKNSKNSVDTATELTGDSANVVLTDSFFSSLASTHQGRSDATLGDSRILQYYQLKLTGAKARTISLGENPKNIAFAVKKGNKEVLNQINQGLAAIKADGTYNKLVEKWFGYQAQQ